MDWRRNMGVKTENKHFQFIEQKPQKEQKVGLRSEMETDLDSVIAELNDVWRHSGYTIEDIRLEERKRAGELDQQMTRSANSGDLSGFKEALNEWKACWMPEL